MAVAVVGDPVHPQAGEGVVFQVGDDVAVQLAGGLTGHLRLGVIDAELVVLDVVAVHADGGFPIEVLDVVIAQLELLDVLVAHPLAHFGEARQPGVIDPGPGGGDGHGGVQVVRGYGLEGVVELGAEAGKHGPDGGAID